MASSSALLSWYSSLVRPTASRTQRAGPACRSWSAWATRWSTQVWPKRVSSSVGTRSQTTSYSRKSRAALGGWCCSKSSKATCSMRATAAWSACWSPVLAALAACSTSPTAWSKRAWLACWRRRWAGVADAPSSAAKSSMPDMVVACHPGTACRASAATRHPCPSGRLAPNPSAPRHYAHTIMPGPWRLLEVSGFLLADRHLPIGFQNRHLAPLGDQGPPDAVHLRVMEATRLVVLVQCRQEGIAGSVQQGFQVGIHEVPVDRIELPHQELPQHCDGTDVIGGEIVDPAYVIGVVGLVGCDCVGETRPHPRTLRRGRRRGAQAEVLGIVAEDHAQPSRAIGSHPTPHDDAGQGDRLAMLSLEGEQPWVVSMGIFTGQVADLETANPHRYRVGVVWVVGLGRQHGESVHSTRASGSARPPTSRQRLS